MTADQLIDSYVADVVMLLPRKQRRDVAQELRMLLGEEVDAAAIGRSSRDGAARDGAARDGAARDEAARDGAARDEAARDGGARELLANLGRPANVAARYGSPVTLIDPADTRRFLTLAVAGAVLIPFGAILNELVVHADQQRDLKRAIEQAWPTVFAWPGLLAVGFSVAAWVRRRQPNARWKPRPMPTDRINRLGRTAAIIFFVAGTCVLVNPAWAIRAISGDPVAAGVYDAFAYDEGFLRLRGPVVLAVLILGLITQAALVWQGRWRPWIHQAIMVQSLVTCVVLTWAVGAGPVFTAVPTDQAAKGATALIVLVSLIDLAVRSRRQHVRQAIEIRDDVLPMGSVASRGYLAA